MASGRVILPAFMPALDADGEPIEGAKLYTYANNTTTPLAVYSDATLTTPLTNPVVADAGGVFVSVFADTAQLYSMTVTDASDAPLAAYDNVKASAVLATDEAALKTANLSDLADKDAATNALTFLQAGTGALARSVRAKLRDVVSVKDFGAVGNGVTDDTAAITAAVAAAKVAGVALFWPTGTYLTSASIPDLHNVVHTGRGLLKRGSLTFALFAIPLNSFQNTLYVRTTGADTNDGLSASEPLRTIQKAVDILAALTGGPVANRCFIDVGAGTYNENVVLPDRRFVSDVYFTIKGSAVATNQTTPVTIIDGTSNGASVALNCGNGNKVKLQDLLFTNWGSVGGGIDAVRMGVGGDLWAVNMQSLDGTCRSLWFLDRGAIGYIEGGIKDGGRIGLDCYSGSTATLGYGSTSTANATIIRNTTQAGVYNKSHVHVVSNNCVYEANSVAVFGYHNSRFDLRSDNFKRNGRCFLLQGSYISETVGSLPNYNYGTADANTIVYDFNQFSSEDVRFASATAALDVSHSRTSSSALTGDLNDNSLGTVWTIPAYFMTKTGRYLELEVWGACTGAGGNKTIRVKAGSNTLATFTVSTGSVTWRARVLIWVNNNTSCVVMLDGQNASPAVVRSVPGWDATVDQALAVYGQLANAADSVQLHERRCLVWG